jgi:uncharacterized protein YndB with AHSA1/START domain
VTEERILGALRSIDDCKGAVRVHDLYATDIDDLWSALTEPERLARWIADVEGDLSLGGSFNARFTSTWEGPGRVDICDPPQRLLLTMNPDQDDETVIEATLTAENGGTRLVVEERGLRSLHSPRTGPVGRRTSRTSLPSLPAANRLTGAAAGLSCRRLTASSPTCSSEHAEVRIYPGREPEASTVLRATPSRSAAAATASATPVATLRLNTLGTM